MRTAWRGVTLRGRSLIAAGCALAAYAFVLDQRDLLRVAVLLVALPAVAAWVVSRRNDRVEVSRRVQPERVTAGGSAQVRLQLRSATGGQVGPLQVTDLLDPELGPSQHLVVERLDPRTPIETVYALDTRTRGRHRIGPLTLTLEDPFGLVRTSRSTTAVHALTVTPQVVPLRPGPIRARSGGSGEGATQRTAIGGQDDVGTREYRTGDELRHVHWRSTARTGSLMVRQEEQPWEAGALVLLDTRRIAHTTSAPGGPHDSSSSSLEWAVQAAASIAAHLARTDRRVRLLAGRTDVSFTGGATGAMLDALAAVRHDRDGVLVPAAVHRDAAPVVVAVLGATDARDDHAIARLRGSAATGVALVLDTSTWSSADRGVRSRQELAAPLLAAGWRVAVVGRGDDVADAWDRAGRS